MQIRFSGRNTTSSAFSVDPDFAPGKQVCETVTHPDGSVEVHCRTIEKVAPHYGETDSLGQRGPKGVQPLIDNVDMLHFTDGHRQLAGAFTLPAANKSEVCYTFSVVDSSDRPLPLGTPEAGRRVRFFTNPSLAIRELEIRLNTALSQNKALEEKRARAQEALK